MKKKLKFAYKSKQIKKAANFLWKKNPVYQNSNETVDDIYVRIYKDLMRYVTEVKSNLKDKKDWRILSTGGYTIIIMLEDDDYLIAEVLVDAAVNAEPDFVEIEL